MARQTRFTLSIASSPGLTLKILARVMLTVGRTSSAGRGCAKVAATMATKVAAHITGTVWKIEVKVGDSVSEGTTLVILESMKMEIPVVAEGAGTITTLGVAEGDVVQEDDLIAVIE